MSLYSFYIFKEALEPCQRTDTGIDFRLWIPKVNYCGLKNK